MAACGIEVDLRVPIDGSPGAGKTTLAKALADRFGWPVVHLDMLFFNADGSSIARAEGVQKLAVEARKRDGIVEGNHGAALAVCVAQAERIIILRMGRWRSL